MAKVLFDSLLDVTGTVQIDTREIVVTLDKRALLRFVWARSLAQMRVVSDWSIRNRLEGTCG